MSTEPFPGPERSPEDCGWLTWESFIGGASAGFDVRLAQQNGHCSLRGCGDVAAAAVRRTRSRSRPPFWQPYCERHAYDRGVTVGPDGLGWTSEFTSGQPDPSGAVSP